MDNRELTSLFSYDGYQNITHPIPFLYECTLNNSSILYFGSQHTFDINNPSISLLSTVFDKFNPDIILIEGMIQVQDRNYIYRLSKMESDILINQYGETGYAAVLGFNQGKALFSPEPCMNDEIDFIMEHGYSIYEIFAFYILQLIHQYQLSNMEITLDCYVSKGIAFWRHFADCPFNDLNECVLFFQKNWGIDIRNQSESYYAILIDPIDRGTSPIKPLQKISELSSIRRDISVIRWLEYQLPPGKKVLIVYGAAHAYNHRSFYEKMGIGIRYFPVNS